MKRTEGSLKELTREDAVVQRLEQTPGVGLIVATGMRARSVTSIALHLAGICRVGSASPPEHSSERKDVGSDQQARGCVFATQLIHGHARCCCGEEAAGKGRELDRLRRWALDTERRVGHNKATVALANKLARIIWRPGNTSGLSMATGNIPPRGERGGLKSFPASCTRSDRFHAERNAAGAVKPRTLVALEVIGVDCLCAGDFHDVRHLTSPIQDEYTVAAVIRFDACIQIKNSAQRYRHH